MFAAEKGHLDVVELLIKNGVNVLLEDRGGESARDKARDKKRDTVIRRLEDEEQRVREQRRERRARIQLEAWEEAKAHNDISSYETFLSRGGKFESDARDAIRIIIHDVALAKAGGDRDNIRSITNFPVELFSAEDIMKGFGDFYVSFVVTHETGQGRRQTLGAKRFENYVAWQRFRRDIATEARTARASTLNLSVRMIPITATACRGSDPFGPLSRRKQETLPGQGRRHPMRKEASPEQVVQEIRRKTRRRFSAEEKIRIVLEGLRGEESIATLCRKEGLAPNLYYRWSKEFLEAGKKRLVGDMTREATSTEVSDLRKENTDLKQLVAEMVLENRLLKKTVTAAGSEDDTCD